MLFFVAQISYAGVSVRGFLQSSVYGWENMQSERQLDYYQGLQLRISPESHPGLYFNTYLREAYRGDPAEWQERVYDFFVNWDAGKNYRFRIGRQFIYKGVMNGTFDAAVFSGRLINRLQYNVLAGTVATDSRSFKIREWDDGNVIGGALSYFLPLKSKIELSYVQKQRQSDLYWQQAGGTLDGFIRDRINYYARFDYNILKSDYQTMRFRLGYLVNKWSLSAEYNSQKPRIYEDSFFNMFDIKAYNQVRTAFTYRLGMLDFGLQYLYTKFEDDANNRIIPSVTSKYGTIGLIYQDGYGGKNIGYFGELRYEFFPNLTAKIYNSYYNYERTEVNISEDALAFSAGLTYRLKQMLILQGDVQQMSNTYYENDWRGLFQLTYLFRL